MAPAEGRPDQAEDEEQQEDPEQDPEESDAAVPRLTDVRPGVDDWHLGTGRDLAADVGGDAGRHAGVVDADSHGCHQPDQEQEGDEPKESAHWKDVLLVVDRISIR
jgi:hypothetical protein